MNILIVRIGRLGDMVMILPAIQEIRKQYPNAVLHLITSKDGLRLLPLVGIDIQHILVYRNALLYRFIDTFRLKNRLSHKTFDHIFCFESKKRTVSWLPVSAKILPSSSEVQHYATRCLQLVSSQAMPRWFEPDYNGLKVLPDKQHLVTETLRDYDIDSNTIVIGLHPTYSGFGKWGRQKEQKHRIWSEDNFSTLAIQLRDYAKQRDLDLKIVMSLLPEEQAVGARIVQKSQGAVILISASLGFQGYLGYLHRLNALVVTNTGVMHLAAALGTPVVSLFSNLAPEDCGPYARPDRCVVIRAEDTSQPMLGLQAITVASVLQGVLQLLQHDVDL